MAKTSQYIHPAEEKPYPSVPESEFGRWLRGTRDGHDFVELAMAGLMSDEELLGIADEFGIYVQQARRVLNKVMDEESGRSAGTNGHVKVSNYLKKAIGKITEWKKGSPPGRTGYVSRFDRHQEGAWGQVWNELDGDQEKCRKRAAKIPEVTDPEVFCLALEHFVTGKFRGETTERQAAFAREAAFLDYIKALATSHRAKPHPSQDFYRAKGFNYDGFIDLLEKASGMPDEREAVRHLNARGPNLGSDLYDSYLLAEFGHPEAGRFSPETRQDMVHL